jgi:hypothetical protein
MKRSLIAAALAAATIGAAAYAVPTPTDFNIRWTNAMRDLATVQSAIPQEKLHARALEILRGMTVARDDDAAADDIAHADARVTRGQGN